MATLNVKTMGAHGDGKTDDTAAINSVIAKAASGDTVYVPSGTYMIDPKQSVKLRNNMTFQLEPTAKLKAFPISSDRYEVLLLQNISNVFVTGGLIEGERDGHTGTGGEWGMGLSIRGCSNVTISNIISSKCWGDGFYIAAGATRSKNLKFTNVLGDNNRRQGMSIIDVDTMTVINSTFSNTKGTDPQDGIEFEPNKDSIIHNVSVTGCRFIKNANAGVEFATKRGNVTNCKVSNCSFSGNGVTIKSNTFSWLQKTLQDIGMYNPTSISV